MISHRDAETEGLPRILIRTFPPTTNANYGGVLQAWAMQRIVNSLGYDSFVDSTRSDRPYRWRPESMLRARLAIAAFLPYRLVPACLRNRVYGAYFDNEILRFAPSEISTVALYQADGTVDSEMLDSFDGIIVGSDQVWRPKYVHVTSYLLDFLPDGFAGPRVAYAASFGTEEPEFDDHLRAVTAPLARKLTAVSVRENSGVDLCRRLWGVSAVQMPDPTTLIDPSVYRKLSEPWSGDGAVGQLVTYLLDASRELQSAVSLLGVSLRVPIREVIRRPVLSGMSLMTLGSHLRKPSVYEWLRLMETAEYVVTDSFHGSVFSVLFERPFLAVSNEVRGRSRFESFLDGLGLLDRLVSADDDLTARMEEPIDWRSVREQLRAQRADALEFLKGALDPPDVKP